MKIKENIFNIDKAKNKAEIFNRMKNNAINKDQLDKPDNKRNELLREVKRLKKELEKSKSQEKRANERINFLSNKNEELNEEVKKIQILMRDKVELENEIHELKEVFDEEQRKLEVVISNKNELLKKKNEIIKENNLKIQQLQDSEVWVQFQNHKQSTTSTIKRLNKEIESLNKAMMHMKNDHKDARSTYRENVKKLNDEINKLKNELRVVEEINNLTPSESLFQHLTDQMNIDNFHQFSSYKLISSRYHYLKSLKYKKDKRENLNVIENHVVDEYDYGYLVKDEDQWFFINLNNLLFKVNNSEEQELIEGHPVKVTVINSESVVVEDVFNHFTKMNENNRVKVKKKFNKEKTEYDYIGDFKVLLIGSINLSRYAERLKKHGIDAIVYNPYEESRKALNNKLISSDIVLHMVRHSKHLGSIKNLKSNKIELIDNDNEEILVVKARYVAIRLGLIGVKS